MKFRPLAQTKYALPIGVFALVAAILMERFLPSNQGLNFLEGFLFGLSMVFNLSYISQLRNQQKEQKNNRVID